LIEVLIFFFTRIQNIFSVLYKFNASDERMIDLWI